jgi:hypothetical protein
MHFSVVHSLCNVLSSVGAKDDALIQIRRVLSELRTPFGKGKLNKTHIFITFYWLDVQLYLCMVLFEVQRRVSTTTSYIFYDKEKMDRIVIMKEDKRRNNVHSFIYENTSFILLLLQLYRHISNRENPHVK